MKLNLIPATVKKSGAARGAVIGAILLVVVSGVLATFLITSSQQSLRDAKQELVNARPQAEEALAYSNLADTTVTRADSLLKHRALADAILVHSAKYPALYDEMKLYIPSFFRVTSMTAQPVGEGVSRIVLVGTLNTYQQYADLMFALFRMKGVQSVGRANYVPTEMQVPPVTLADQTGRPRRLNETPIPQDPLERLAYFEAQGSTETFSGAGNYGTANTDTRFALPTSSLVQIEIIIARDLRVPDVRGNLPTTSSAAATPATPIGGGGIAPGGADAGDIPPEDR